MKKLTSLVCVLLAVILLLSSLPVAMAQTTTIEPKFDNSFLLCVKSETRQEYSVSDFPLVENLCSVSIVQMVPTEIVKKDTVVQGYQYTLLMVTDSFDADLLAKAKSGARNYGRVCVNYMASDYADANSFIEINHNSLELKVGETANLDVTLLGLEPNKEMIGGILFTVNPEVVDEETLVESGYKDWGLSLIFADENPLTASCYENTAVWGEPDYGAKNQVSSTHSYIGIGGTGGDLFQIIHDLSKRPGIVKAQLFVEYAVYTQEMPYAVFASSPDGIVDIKGGIDAFKSTVTALQPGETTITVKATGGGMGTATATCQVTVVEEVYDGVQPTPEEELYAHLAVDMGEINGDGLVDAKDALLVLQYSVEKIHRLENVHNGVYIGETPFEADLNGDRRINAVDALMILKMAVGKGIPDITTIPWGEFQTQTAVESRYQTDYLKPVLIKSALELEYSNILPWMKAQLQSHNFGEYAVVVFGDITYMPFTPVISQVAVNDSRLLVRYRYTTKTEKNQHYMTAFIPQEYVSGVITVDVEQLEGERSPILYQFEYDGNGAPQQEDTQVILRSAGQVEEFLNVLDKAGLSNQQVTELLKSRANGKYFQNYTLLVEYNHGVNGGDSGHQTIASIVKEGTTAKIDAVPNFTSNGAPDARFSAWVKIADLPNDKIEGCDTFMIT